MMSNDVQFDFDETTRPSFSTKQKEAKLVRWVMDHSRGRIKNETQANFVLFGVIVFFIALSFLMWPKEQSEELSPRQLEINIWRMNNLPVK